MRPTDLLGRTSVRLALAVALLLIAAFALPAAVAWGMIRAQLRDQEDRHILQTWQAIAAEVTDGPAELVAVVDEHVAGLRDLTMVIRLADASGAALAGNLPRFDGPAGWSDAAAGDLDLHGAATYRLHASRVGPDLLVVGSYDADLHEVGEIVAGAFGWGSVAALIVALAGGSILAAGVQRRMERMEAVLARVGEGDLAARMPTKGRGDLAHLARGINGALARLEGLVEGMRQVTTDVAHDLRTPLARLRQRVEAAQAQAPEGSAIAAGLDAALAEADGLDATFAALLRIAEVEGGARRARFAPLDLAEVAGRVAEAYAGVAEDAGQSLTLDAPGLAPIQGDRDLLTQLLANLVENAIHHAGPGAAIVCTVIGEDSGATLAVRDSGPGIPEGERERVLRRLYRLEKSRTTPGTGLGLALVKAVANLHGAELTLADARPGLLVRVRFPGPEART